MSLDGHDEMCGYQNSMFPLCIYEGQDTYSGRINFLRIWTTNSNPKVIGRFYLDYLYQSKGEHVTPNTSTYRMFTYKLFLFLIIFSNKIIQNFIESIRYATTTTMHNNGCEGMSGKNWQIFEEKEEKIIK